jgi:type III pantothenate kinase
MTTGNLLLCLDLGNTRLAGGVFRAGRLLGSFRLPAICDRSSLEDELGHLIPADETVNISLCSVSPSGDRHLIPLLRSLNYPVTQIHGDSVVPLPVKIEGRKILGADRLCNAAAAWSRNLFPSVIIDAGTAVTFDVLDRDGSFAGGLIFPGRRLLSSAMATGGEMLFESGESWPARILGRDTVSALTAGAHWGLLAAAEGIAGQLDREAGYEHQVILTGGDAVALGNRWSTGEPLVDQDLTLRGIAALAAAGVGEPVE